MNNYYKYIKYKNKYLKFKKQLGGSLGIEECPKHFSNISVLDCLRKYKCTFVEIKKNILSDLNSFTYKEFLKSNQDNPKKQISVFNLKSRGFSALFLQQKEFPLDVLKKAEFSVSELKEAGFKLEYYKFEHLDIDYQGVLYAYK